MKPEKLLDNYMADMERELRGLSSRERREALLEIRTHILEKWNAGGELTSAGMLNVLEGFGEPADIAREYGASDRGPGNSIPLWLVAILTVFLWPVGIILAWISNQWRTKHKLIATLIPVVLIALMIISTTVTYLSVRNELVNLDPTEFLNPGLGFPPGFPSQGGFSPSPRKGGLIHSNLNAVTLVLAGFSPLISGVYLVVTRKKEV